MTRHFAYFSQDDGRCIREWSGPVPDPDIHPVLVGETRLLALNAWQQQIAPAGMNEVGLDVTQFGWPVGDFCYCVFDTVSRLLDWGPDRYYIEINTTTLEVVANTSSHRPIRDAVPGQHVIDVTGTPMEPFHGHIWGRFVFVDGRWAFDPRDDLVPQPEMKALAETSVDGFEEFRTPVRELERVLVERTA